MDRPLVYSLAEIRSFDHLMAWQETLIGLCQLASDMLGQQSSIVTKLVATASSPTSLVVNLTQGAIYQMAAVDAAVDGSLPANNLQILQQGIYPGGEVTLSTGSITAGQNCWVLVEGTFVQADEIDPNDPNAGILPYINVANPGTPYEGPGNSGNPQNTRRQGLLNIQLKYGTPATAGSEVPPSADTGYVPLYLIDLSFGQSTITQAQILLAGPAAYAGYPNAPFFPGVTGMIPFASAGSHHGGINGQAQKIVLTGGAEIQGSMPFAQLPVFILEVGAAAGGATYELTLTHVVELRYESGVHDEALTKSWDDVFTDYAAWEAAGGPDGYVWGTNWSLAYPGLSAPDDDPAAQAWSKRLAKPMYRALIETDRFSLSVIFHSARWKKLCEGAPTVEQVLIPMA